jgi:predicted nucleic acid-binding protein
VELADTSAWIWTRAVGGEQSEAFAESVVEGEIAICDVVRLELLFSARNADEFAAIEGELAALPDCVIGKPEWTRALAVYRRLAQQGGSHQRSVKHADLLIASAAEGSAVGILHYDEDFDRIAALTGQATRWLAPRGSLG